MVTPTQRTRAEASAWIARLQRCDGGPSPDVAAGLQRWLLESPHHRAAFEQASTLWDMLGGLTPPAPRMATAMGAASMHRVFSMVTALLIAAFFLVTGPHQRPLYYATATGEQRAVLLEDGSRVTLNTASAFMAIPGQHDRRILLEKGEALFEVAHDPGRPFRVQHRGGTVTALGTTFLVYDAETYSAVTLIEGQVVAHDQRTAGPTFLSPGERLTVSRTGQAVIDRPPPDSVASWRDGHILFDDVSLKDAATEMNRYTSHITIRVSPSAEALRLSGIFATGRPYAFATAVQMLYSLSVTEEGSTIRLDTPSRETVALPS